MAKDDSKQASVEAAPFVKPQKMSVEDTKSQSRVRSALLHASGALLIATGLLWYSCLQTHDPRNCRFHRDPLLETLSVISDPSMFQSGTHQYDAYKSVQAYLEEHPEGVERIQDRYILTLLMAVLGGTLDDMRDHCEWDPVTCNAERLTERIELMNLPLLGGTLPREIGFLRDLNSLTLDELGLVSTIPTEVGRLFKLTNLVLGINHLEGTIPEQLGYLTKLVNLCLKNNELHGTIPTRLGRLDKLTGIGLRQNRLTGTIPSELGLIKSLARMTLSDNLLEGSLPNELANLERLGLLFVHGNPNLDANLDAVFCTTGLDSSDCAEEGVVCSCCTRCCNNDEVCSANY